MLLVSFDIDKFQFDSEFEVFNLWLWVKGFDYGRMTNMSGSGDNIAQSFNF